MNTESGFLDIPQDVPPPLQYSAELLHSVALKASQSHRNSQKGLHLVARCIIILEDLCLEFSEEPDDFEEMLASMEALQKFELLLLEAKLVVEQEAELPPSVDSQTTATWGDRRDALLDLLVEAHDEDFFPPEDWENGVEEVMRVDDHLWVDLAAQQLRETDPEAAEQAERVATFLLENPLTPENAAIRNTGMQRVMTASVLADRAGNSSPSPPPPPPKQPVPPRSPIEVEPPQPASPPPPPEVKSLPPPPSPLEQQQAHEPKPKRECKYPSVSDLLKSIVSSFSLQ
ncbi:hypothetical protein FRB90_002864 [Tulasnella sp. 427]|nr:hypothetical protein FRB90_002864 [Tulasnella sp. 427]